MDELEREIERMLTVNPSPEFVARVRTRVAHEHIAFPWYRGWRLAAAACAVATIAVVLVWRSDQRLDPTTREIRQLSARAIGSSVTLPPPAATSLRLPRETQASVSRVERPAAAVRTTPEVLIAQDEAVALRRLLRGDYAQSLGEPVSAAPTARLALEPPQTIELSPIAEISIINIEPLRIAANPEGVRQ